MLYDKFFKQNRPELSINSIKSYSSNLRAVQKNVNIKIETPNDVVENIDKILEVYDNIKYNTRKAHISALVSFIDDESEKSKPALTKLRNILIKDITTYNEYINTQSKSRAQDDNWLNWDDILKRYNQFEKEVNPLWRIKPEDLNKANYNKLQMFVLISCYVLIPPRRSLDYTSFKLRNYDENKDNYMKGKKFIFNNYKTAKTYGKNEVAISTKLYSLITKWARINKSDWLLNGANSKVKPISAPQLNNLLNNFFDKRVSVNILRHSFLTHLYKDIPALEDMKERADAMGHSLESALTYVKKDV
jgi:integrase